MPTIRVRNKGKGNVLGKLQAIGGKNLTSASSLMAAKYTLGQVKAGFRKESDPYGSRWARKQKPDGRKVLTGKTKKLKSNFQMRLKMGGGFRIKAATPYASFHQDGTGKMPARMIFPDSRGLPDKWARKFKSITKAEIKKIAR